MLLLLPLLMAAQLSAKVHTYIYASTSLCVCVCVGVCMLNAYAPLLLFSCGGVAAARWAPSGTGTATATANVDRGQQQQ